MRKAYAVYRIEVIRIKRCREPLLRIGLRVAHGGWGKTLVMDYAGSKGGRGSLEAGALANPGKAVPEW